LGNHTIVSKNKLVLVLHRISFAKKPISMKSLTLLSALILISVCVRSQSVSSSVVNCAGNSYSQGYYNIDWSVGELALVNSMQSSGFAIITNGFLQPTSADYKNDARVYFTSDEVTIMPNPTHGKIEVNFSTAQQGTVYLYVYDVNGKVMTSDKLLLAGIRISKFIDLSTFASASYFLKLELKPAAGSVKKTGSYKIIKF